MPPRQITLTDVWDIVFPNLDKGYDTPDKLDHDALKGRLQELMQVEEVWKDQCKWLRRGKLALTRLGLI